MLVIVSVPVPNPPPPAAIARVAIRTAVVAVVRRRLGARLAHGPRRVVDAAHLGRLAAEPLVVDDVVGPLDARARGRVGAAQPEDRLLL